MLPQAISKTSKTHHHSTATSKSSTPAVAASSWGFRWKWRTCWELKTAEPARVRRVRSVRLFWASGHRAVQNQIAQWLMVLLVYRYVIVGMDCWWLGCIFSCWWFRNMWLLISYESLWWLYKLMLTTRLFDPMIVENNFMSLYVHGPPTRVRVNAPKGGIH